MMAGSDRLDDRVGFRRTTRVPARPGRAERGPREAGGTMGERGYLVATRDGCLIEAHVQPGARATEIVGPHGDALKFRIRAQPVGGRANLALESYVADLLGISKSSVEVVSGRGARRKRIAVRGMPPADVSNALERVLSSRAHEPG
ncbi:MAG: DUF167 domain-containing protein [Actinomycetota bacterium]